MPDQAPAPFRLDLEDITAPDPQKLAPGTPWWIWFAIAAGSVLLVTLFVIWFKNRDNKVKIDKLATAYAAAGKDITSTREAADSLDSSALATKLSLTLRLYLEEVSADPSLFQTHEEFLLSPQALSSLPENTRQTTQSFFDHLAAAKYGQKSELSGATTLCDEALKLLQTLDSSHPDKNL